jgi:hypothetical protein
MDWVVAVAATPHQVPAAVQVAITVFSFRNPSPDMALPRACGQTDMAAVS